MSGSHTTAAVIGDARISTEDQNLDLQRDAVTRAGCTPIYEDRKSAAKAERPGLMLALKVVRAGASWWSGASTGLDARCPHLIGLIRTLDDRGVELRSLTEGIDTGTINGKFTFHLFAALAEFERALIRERTQAGLVAARPRPQSWSAESLDAQKRRHAVAPYRGKQHTVAEIWRLMGISNRRSTTIWKRPVAEVGRVVSRKWLEFEGGVISRLF
jgi:DNA invertase Pin-like site-specific DNA recombinase